MCWEKIKTYSVDKDDLAQKSKSKDNSKIYIFPYNGSKPQNINL